jgi:uncharacterized protein
MIRIQFVRDSGGSPVEFCVSGHAGAGKSGKDIVCSAVSAVAYTAAGSLIELVKINDFIEADGYMKCAIPDYVTGEERVIAGIIMKVAEIGFRQIAGSYGEYISIIE